MSAEAVTESFLLVIIFGEHFWEFYQKLAEKLQKKYYDEQN